MGYWSPSHSGGVSTLTTHCHCHSVLFTLNLGGLGERKERVGLVSVGEIVCVCLSVCVSVTQHLTFHVIIRVKNDNNLLSGG